VADQAGRLVHCSNLYRIPLQECLAARLAEFSGLDRAFFCNSGAEANEAAIKLARLYGHGRGREVPTVAVARGSFHGRTLATLSASGSRKVQAGFEPLVKGFARVPYDDLAALETLAANNQDVVAVLVEPVQGEGGVVVPSPGYLAGVRELCDRQGWLMMVDEVQTGMGRTGAWFGYQHEGVVPDVVTLAKGLGNGFPIGACLAREEVAALMVPGTHGSTFGGSPLACSAALAVVTALTEGDVPAHAGRTGDHLAAALRQALSGVDGVREVRHRGLMVGVELDRPCGGLVPRALERGLLINVTAERVVRLVPPLVMDREQADFAAATVAELVREFLAHG
jgi:acetylornithine aminotransferase